MPSSILPRAGGIGMLYVCILLVLISYNVSSAHEDVSTSVAHMSLFLNKEQDLLHHIEDYVQKETIRLDLLSR